MARALITGVTGQDGSYLADLLTSKGYEVHGLVRQPAPIDLSRIGHLLPGPSSSRRTTSSFALHYMDMSDAEALQRLMRAIEPDEVYHLAAASHVRGVLDDPDFVDDISGLDTTRLLEAIRKLDHECRFFQASSSDMYAPSDAPRNEEPPFEPRSAYGTAKVYSHWITKIYRDSHSVFAVNGVLYNHDSPRRSDAFVTRRITRAAARAKAGLDVDLKVSSADDPQDLGFAGDYVDAMWRMLQAAEPSDYVVATGTTTTLREFADHAFEAVGLDAREFVRFDERSPGLTPTSPVGDTTKAERELGWTSTTSAAELARHMVDAEFTAALAAVGTGGR